MIGKIWGYIAKNGGGGGGTNDIVNTYIVVSSNRDVGGGGGPFEDCGGTPDTAILQENGDYLLLNDSVPPSEGGRDGCIMLQGGEGGGG